MKHIKCINCGELYDFEGWNIKEEEAGMGNNYNYSYIGDFLIKYTICTKCKHPVVLVSHYKYATEVPNTR